MAQFRKTLTCDSEDNTVCMGVHECVCVAPTHGYYAPKQGWRQLHSCEDSREKKGLTECDLSIMHSHKMEPGGLRNQATLSDRTHY